MSAPKLTRALLKGHKDSVLCLSSDAAPSSSSSSKATAPGRLASGSADGSVRLWDLRCPTGRRCVRAAFLQGEVSSVAISPAKEHLILAASGCDVFGFDLRSEKVILQEPVSRSPGLAKEDSGAVHLLDLNTWRLDKTLAGKNGHDNICSSVAWHPGSGWGLASGGLDAAVVLWKRSGRGRMARLQADTGEDSATSSGGPQLFNPPFVHSLAFLPGGHTLAAGLGDGTVALLDGESGEQKGRLRGGHGAAVAQVAHSPAGLVSAGNDLMIILWGEKEEKLRLAHHEKVNWMVWSEDTLFVAGLGNEIVAYAGLDR